MPANNVTVKTHFTMIPVSTTISSITVNGNPAQSNGNNNFSTVAPCGINSVTLDITVDPNATAIIEGGNTVNLSDGENNINITVTAPNSNAQTYVLTIIKPIPFEQLIKVRWNNTMSVITNPTNNGGYTFNDYKWYRNGEPFSTDKWWSAGENGEPINPNDVYYVEVTGANTSGISKTLRSCEACITTLKTLEVKAYPNPVLTGQTIYIEADLDAEHIKDATIEVYNMSGVLIDNLKLQGRLTTVNVKYISGVYVFILKSNDGFHKEIKIVIE
jgi:hypothetical protein